MLLFELSSRVDKFIMVESMDYELSNELSNTDLSRYEIMMETKGERNPPISHKVKGVGVT